MGYNLQDNVYIYSNNKCMCVFLISPVPIAEPLTSELIDTPVFYNLAPRPIKYRVSVPIPRDHRRGHTPRSVPGGTLDLMGKEDRGSPVLIFPSNPSASTATAPPQRQRGRCCEDAGEKLPPQREFSPPVREEHTVCNVIYFRPHWPLICLLLVFLCLSF